MLENEAIAGIERYRDYLGKRYDTMRCAFDEFVRQGGRTIVELGTTRSFVRGGHPGCAVNDTMYWQPDDPANWDWGGGIFTRVCAEHLRPYRPELHTVDISPDALDICKTMTADYQDLIQYHLQSSEDFLATFDKPIDLLYMDAGETESGADFLHLREAQIVIARNLLSPRAIVLIDDVNVPGTTESKGRHSIPFLQQNGFQIAHSNYQVVMQRP